MTETVKELLSVLIDGEASEIELHRLLRQLGEDDSLIETWVSYQETRRVLRSPSSMPAGRVHLNTRQHLELHHRISQAVEKDTLFGEVSSMPRPALSAVLTRPAALFTRPVRALAMAASLVIAVFIGIQVNTPQGDDVADDSQAIDIQTMGSRVRQPQFVATQPTRESELIADDLELKELDEEGQRRLRAYLNQHDRMARMKSNTSLVTYPNLPDN